MIARTFLSLATITMISSLQFAEDKPAGRGEESTLLIGTYEITGGERDGKKLPGERLKDVTVKIAQNAITTFDKDKKEVYAATYEIDTSSTPWKISMTSSIAPAGEKGAKSKGLIQREGDSVRLIYALPEGETPTDFKTKEKQQLFVLKKMESTVEK